MCSQLIAVCSTLKILIVAVCRLGGVLQRLRTRLLEHWASCSLARQPVIAVRRKINVALWTLRVFLSPPLKPLSPTSSGRQRQGTREG